MRHGVALDSSQKDAPGRHKFGFLPCLLATHLCSFIGLPLHAAAYCIKCLICFFLVCGAVQFCLSHFASHSCALVVRYFHQQRCRFSSV